MTSYKQSDSLCCKDHTTHPYWKFINKKANSLKYNGEAGEFGEKVQKIHSDAITVGGNSFGNVFIKEVLTQWYTAVMSGCHGMYDDFGYSLGWDYGDNYGAFMREYIKKLK